MFVNIENIDTPSGPLRFITPLFGYHRSLIMSAFRIGLSFKVVSHVEISTQRGSELVVDAKI